jgi:predicted nucleic acid-binding protein
LHSGVECANVENVTVDVYTVENNCILRKIILEKMIENRKYLDNCCFIRPFDVQTNLNVYLETQAKLFIQVEVINNNLELAWSFMMEYEILNNPFEDRIEAFMEWKNLSVIDIEPIIKILNKGIEIQQKLIKEKDALHIACAIEAECKYFLTTDKKLLNKNISEIIIMNPQNFIQHYTEK